MGDCYRGHRAEDGTVEVLCPDATRLPCVGNWGDFNWAGGGVGASSLALALAMDILGDHVRALRVWRRLMWNVVAEFPYECWTVAREQLDRDVAYIEMLIQHGPELLAWEI